MSCKLFLILPAVISILLFNCTDRFNTEEVKVTWKFSAGDCVSNNIKKIRIEATSSEGKVFSGEAVCNAPGINLGSLDLNSYTILAQGIDENGVIRAQNYQHTVTFIGGVSDIEVTLHPRRSNLNITWNSCPTGVILPYFITLYNPPAQADAPLTDEVMYAQESCIFGSATLTNVPPGDYILELDSRAITPKIRGIRAITVTAGEDMNIHFNLP